MTGYGFKVRVRVRVGIEVRVKVTAGVPSDRVRVPISHECVEQKRAHSDRGADQVDHRHLRGCTRT